MYAQRDCYGKSLRASLRLSSNADTVSKRMDVSSHIQTVWYRGIFLVFEPQRRYKIPRETPQQGR